MDVVDFGTLKIRYKTTNLGGYVNLTPLYMRELDWEINII